LESRKHREFKLAAPLQFEISNSELIIKDKFANTNIILIDPSLLFSISNPDDDGYVRFDISFLESRKPRQTILPQSEAHVNGFTLFHTNLSHSFGYGGKRSLFDYYKRDSDLSYYVLIKKEGKKDRKLQLGSLSEPNSRIFQVACIIHKRFLRDKAFDKHELTQYLPPPLNGARIIKGTLDILAKEGYLKSDTVKSGKKNRDKEIFSKTEKLEKYMADPRSWQKPNGLNTGSSAMTPNQ
jgi:hypothetical protein